ncbi:MAG: CPBP family intramembrane metalloprotease [bacterium]|nr:CPBP family intramembrane metalloprotease [bacterium]
MEKIYAFLPSIVILACIAGVTFVYVKLVIRRFGDDFKSIEWREKNKWKLTWMVGTPMSNVFAPTAEELIFRAPLIIAFSTMSSAAWYGLFASSVLFAMAHWRGKKISMQDILSVQDNEKSDDLKREVNQFYQEHRKEIMMRKILNVVFTLPLGILAGYYGIMYQSIWLSSGIHLVWNLIIPVILLILTLLGTFVFLGISFLWDSSMIWRRKSL